MTARRIVVCEDDPFNIVLLKRSLALVPGTEVEVYESLGPCLLAIERKRPDLVIMDHHLPGSSGMDGIHKIRSQPWGRDVPILAYTAADVEREALAAGASTFLRKPCTADRIVEKVRTLLVLSGPKAP